MSGCEDLVQLVDRVSKVGLVGVVVAMLGCASVDPKPTVQEEQRPAQDTVIDDPYAGREVASVFEELRGSEPNCNQLASKRFAASYPKQAILERVSGWVIVRMQGDGRGNVREVSVEAASPRGYFERNVIHASLRWEFPGPLPNGTCWNSFSFTIDR